MHGHDRTVPTHVGAFVVATRSPLTFVPPPFLQSIIPPSTFLESQHIGFTQMISS